MHSYQRWWGLLGLSLASFLGCIDFTIVNTALPDIQADLNASVSQLQWIINIFLLSLAAFMVLKGRMGDLYGRRLFLYIGMITFGLASLGAGLAPTIHWLIFFRFIQAIGVAILYTVPVAIITQMFPDTERAKATGILIGANGFGLAIGPVVGGFIISALSWRWIFFINLPVILVSVLICLRTIPESKSHEFGSKIDWLGFVLLAISFPLLIYTTIQASSWGWHSPQVFMGYGLASLGIWLFYIVEKRSTSPIIQLDLFANRMFIISATANILLAFFYTVAFFILPLYLHGVLGQSSYQIGLTLLPTTLMVALLSPLVGVMVNKFGVRNNLLFGFCMLALSGYAQTYFQPDSHLLFIISALLFLGIGWAFILGPTFFAAVSTLPESMSAVVMGTMGTIHNLGGALGLAIGTLFYHFQAHKILLEQAAKLHIAVGPWLEQAIIQPDEAVKIISQQTHLSLNMAEELFKQYFTYSFNALMWLLAGISILGLLTVIIGLKKPVTKEKNVQAN